MRPAGHQQGRIIRVSVNDLLGGFFGSLFDLLSAFFGLLSAFFGFLFNSGRSVVGFFLDSFGALLSFLSAFFSRRSAFFGGFGCRGCGVFGFVASDGCQGEESDQQDRKSTRLNSSHVRISYAVFCLKKKII